MLEKVSVGRFLWGKELRFCLSTTLQAHTPLSDQAYLLASKQPGRKH